MSTKIIAWLMSTFAFLLPLIYGQPAKAPETRTAPFVEEFAPDKYSVWPTEEFEIADAPWWLPTWALRPLYSARSLLMQGSKNEGIVALYRGKIVYEWYGSGWDKDTPLGLASATKSVTQALVGIAIGEGFIDSVDDKLVKYFPDANIEIAADLKKRSPLISC